MLAILAGKRDNRCHSTTDFGENLVVAEANYQMLEVFSVLQSWEILTSLNRITVLTFLVEKDSKPRLIYKDINTKRTSQKISHEHMIYWWLKQTKGKKGEKITAAKNQEVKRV